MKRFPLAILALTLAAATAPSPAARATTPITDFTYISDGFAITIAGYNGLDSDITIPAYIDDLPVTTIGDWAFAMMFDALTRVKLPHTLTTIADEAFWLCTDLTSITIPASVTSIANGAFSDCESLARVYFAGPPPTTDSSAFSGAPATLYYLPAHASQWGSTLAGKTTKLWNPVFAGIVAGASSANLSVTGTEAIPVAIEARSDLLSGAWERIAVTTIPAGGTLSFTDPAAADHPVRLYRVAAP